LKSTNNQQEPYLYGSLGGDDLSLVPAKLDATGPQADPLSAIRRDYELALQLGTRDGWEAFLAQYPDGFYANLARGHVKKIASEEARAAAAEKTRQTEQDKTAAAEITRLAAQEKAAQEVPLREKALREKQQIAALPPAVTTEQINLYTTRALQLELRRVGCNAGVVDGVWGEASQKALDLFNKHAGMKLVVSVATTDALDAVKSKSGRTCPLICETGYRAEGDRCTKITCRRGYVLSENECEKKGPSPVAKRKPETQQRPAERPSSVSTVTRADAAFANRNYQKCMGPISGCYARAVQQMGPERAKIWCSRRPTC
jgi:hypothetical protein